MISPLIGYGPLFFKKNMEQDPNNFTNKNVDESWKDRVWSEKGGNPDAEVPKKEKKEEVSFIAFLNSIALQVLVCLGEIKEPGEAQNTKDFEQAEQMIDLLVLLKNKTKGNLTEQETKFFDSVLADLQLRYVESLKS